MNQGKTVRALCDEAIRNYGSSKTGRQAPPRSTAANPADWSIESTAETIDVDFLPLKLAYGNGRVIFASYNGGNIQDPERIEIPHNLESDIQLEESSRISVEIVSYCPVAKELSLMPKTAEEYQALQLEAEHLEYGGLLQQISVVGTQHQDINIAMASGTVQLRVIEQKKDNEWPSPACWRLMNETEIIILPPLSVPAIKRTHTFQRIPCRLDMIDNEEMERLADELFDDWETRWADVPPKTVAVHPSTGMEHCVAILRSEHGHAFVRVETNVVVPVGAVAIHPLLAFQLDGVNGHHLYDSNFTLEPMKEEVAQETASQFLQAIRGTVISFDQVKFSKEELPRWNTPDIVDEFLCRELPPFDCHQLLKSLNKETPVSVNDILPDSTDRQMVSPIIGKVVADVNPDLFGFAGDLLELFSTGCSTLKQSHVKHATILSPPVLGLRTLLPKASVFRENLLTFVKNLGPQRGCVVCGGSGTGKTHTALSIAATTKLQNASETFYIDCRAMRHSVDLRMRTILDEINRFGGAGKFSKTPATFIIDNLDAFVAGKGSQAGVQSAAQTQGADDVEIDQSKLFLDVLKAKICSLDECGSRGTFFIVTSATIDIIDQYLKDCRFWGTVFDIPPLNTLERRLLFRSALLRSRITCPNQLVSGFDKLCNGFRCRDFDRLASGLRGSRGEPTSELLEKQLKCFVPICKVDVQSPSGNQSFKSIGALFEPKRCLEETVIRPSRYRRIFSAAKVRLPRGLLLYGFSGTGKTALVTALSNECGYSLVTCNGPEILDKYIGASETKVRELFDRAASAAPSILFFDEFDALAPRRGSDNSGVTDRIVNQLLTFLDGVSDVSKDHGEVFIVAASSRPDKIDPALLRPGRLEKHIFCGLISDSFERQDMLLKLSWKYPVDKSLEDAISTGTLLETVDLPVTGLSGADIDAIFSAAYTKAIHEAIGCMQSGSNLHVRIQISHFRLACAEATISIPAKELQLLHSIYARFAGKIPATPHPHEQSQRVALR